MTARMSRHLALGVTAIATSLVASTAGAQSWRTLDVARQLSDSAPASVQVVYGTGQIGVRATSSPLLYHMQLRYDASRSQPRHSFDVASRKLQIGVQKSEMRFSGRNDADAAHLQL